jgi:hypothetical protein
LLLKAIIHFMTDSGDDRRDHMAPPEVPCECWCMHCGRTFMSDKMWFQKMIGDPSGFDGFWMCPTPNCGGAGFTFDIFPTDPAHPANEGWHYFEDEEDEEDGEEDDDWDPEESKYAELDEEMGDDDDDLEGEEWKHGLGPGERPEVEESASQAEARREWEERQKKYDAPDERPREIQWQEPPRPERQGDGSDDDVPF